MVDPVMITAAVTGSIASARHSPHIPLSIEQIVEAAVESSLAGAAIVHVHARDAHGTPTQDPATCRALLERLRDRGCEAIVNLSTGSAGGRATIEQRLGCIELAPEMATLDCGSVNLADGWVFANPYSAFLQPAAERLRDLEIAVEIETFDSGMIRNGLRLMREGLLRPPGFWQLCVGVPAGAAPDLQTIGYLLGRLPEGARWSMLGIGRHQLEVNVLSLLYGGHVRTGLEDNVYYRRGQLARSNAQLVERVVRLAEEFGRPVATPEEARRMLGVRGYGEVDGG
ncbi:MAG TPA: 3-keto-5-aminohexanoate cleavage protein [Solirubrobacteraceae bacterium]|jgi:3-keto-5-aminohexanoate cleavage enzyme|nr:3-keto-5-aminohexanoate cleavage protein [Solirubrobacteraceae bacterium]